MRLASFEVREFKSVLDSNSIKVGDITCLVGKNEAGKTAILRALYRLNPILPEDGTFDVTDDYPRMEVEDYRQDVESARRHVALPITATYHLDPPERAAIASALGSGCFKATTFSLTKSYNNKRHLNLGAGNFLTRQIMKYWSQNRHLQMRFDVRPARPGDPEEMREGTNIWGEVYDTRHLVSTDLGTRSRGFVWFFSFLAWYSQVRQQSAPFILLLDEPGLTLHGKAQGDLLRYFEEELKAKHQVIYTTHSPFMVDPQHFDRVRIVQDLTIDSDKELPRDQQGTKVLHDALGATSDSLFPLQGALGYEVQQTLFVGAHSLIVEGVSDLLYIQIMSSVLVAESRVGIDPRWTVTPVGGTSKLPAFVALLGAQKGMNVATLIDIQPKDNNMIADLYKKLLLEKSKVLTFGQFVGQNEADIEDMFDESFYLELVNGAYLKALSKPIASGDLNSHLPRVLRRLVEYFKVTPLATGNFIHFEPARYMVGNIDGLKGKLSNETKDRFEAAFKAVNSLL